MEFSLRGANRQEPHAPDVSPHDDAEGDVFSSAHADVPRAAAALPPADASLDVEKLWAENRPTLDHFESIGLINSAQTPNASSFDAALASFVAANPDVKPWFDGQMQPAQPHPHEAPPSYEQSLTAPAHAPGPAEPGMVMPAEPRLGLQENGSYRYLEARTGIHTIPPSSVDEIRRLCQQPETTAAGISTQIFKINSKATRDAIGLIGQTPALQRSHPSHVQTGVVMPATSSMGKPVAHPNLHLARTDPAGSATASNSTSGGSAENLGMDTIPRHQGTLEDRLRSPYQTSRPNEPSHWPPAQIRIDGLDTQEMPAANS